MTLRHPSSRPGNPLVTLVFLVGALLALTTSTHAGGVLLRQNNVGGISVNANGIVDQPNVEGREQLRRFLLEQFESIPTGLDEVVPLRKVSLRALQSAIDESLRNNIGTLPEHVQYLAGLQRVQYILVYPEQNDIVLAGPGEAWTVDEQANVVGATTGRPVLLLDDLLVALRTVHAARDVGISCSIDPTADGIRRFNALMSRSPAVRPAILKQVEQTLGPQIISITGAPADSHFARVLVAADYRMKRIAMKLDKSPVRGLPSYLDLVKRGPRKDNPTPRWWLACDYEPLARSDDGLAWELRGPGVKCMTEDEFVTADGTVEGTGKAHSAAQRWADLLTDNYDELSAEDVVFAELRNLMDLSVVAALIEKEQLIDKAGCSLSLLTETDNNLTTDSWNPPKTIATQASLLKKRRGYILTASGGVQIESWRIASQSESSDTVDEVRTKSTVATDNAAWWWN